MQMGKQVNQTRQKVLGGGRVKLEPSPQNMKLKLTRGGGVWRGCFLTSWGRHSPGREPRGRAHVLVTTGVFN